ncbi:amidohydrolase [Photobacterium sp. BZF1]|uniref:amidohydrolase n=1 Tax=Photobacterium sp. BZF1 TaxID=1904457 RepID=UPI00165380D4|nr:amidohydrolase [Photobacterium sp. BZF1]MBC7006501.1 amidohydrolase [Photobacterium sp. BZF1]
MKRKLYLLTTIVAFVWTCGLSAASADRILTDAIIYGYPNADAITISEGKITYIGTSQEANNMADDHTDIINLDGAFVLPGFIDNHNHVFEAASPVGGDCLLDADVSLQSLIPYLNSCFDKTKRGQWIIGYGFSLDAILDENNTSTPLTVIDKIFPDQPVIFMEQTSHSMWVNTQALKQAAINKHSPEPQGGRILKTKSGQLTGILLDNAGDIVMEMAWNDRENSRSQNNRRPNRRSVNNNPSYEGLLAGLEEAAAHGITTIGDGRMYWKRGWFEIWQQAQSDNMLTARVSVRPWIYPEGDMDPQLQYLESIYSSSANDPASLIIVEQVKMYSDGIFINGTAKTLAPYLFTYLPGDPHGINYIPPKEMSVWLKALARIGYGAHIHAIGDGAIYETLNAIESMRKAHISKPYTLTHVELIDRNDIPRFEALDVTADFQVGSDYIAYHQHQWAEAFLGAKRTRALMNLNAIYQTGANVTLSSDWNVHNINPLEGIANSLIMGKTGLPSITTAIDAYTINAAYSLGIDKITGSIEVGKSADFAILDNDITQIPSDRISSSNVLLTILQGEVVFEKYE